MNLKKQLEMALSDNNISEAIACYNKMFGTNIVSKNTSTAETIANNRTTEVKIQPKKSKNGVSRVEDVAVHVPRKNLFVDTGEIN